MATQRVKRSIGSALAVGALSIALAGVPAGSATADPVAAVPNTASEAVQRLTDLSRQSEQLNEQLNNAKIDMDKKAAAQQAAEAKVGADQAVLDAALAKVKQFQPEIDRIAAATYQGARTNRLFAVLLSDSPQQMLDQMSALDVISTETAADVAELQKVSDAAAVAEQNSKKSADAARVATDQAHAFRTDLEKKQADLQKSIGEVTQAWTQLSAGDKAALAGTPFPPGFDADALLRSLPHGSAAGALAAALTRVGDPYVWGATGPNQFDCSGLVQWAYKQVGLDLPRTSEAQAQGGTPVSREDLQPGDVVTFYSDASHVGIYAGNGNILHASTFGVPVKVAPMGNMPFHNARRY